MVVCKQVEILIYVNFLNTINLASFDAIFYSEQLLYSHFCTETNRKKHYHQTKILAFYSLDNKIIVDIRYINNFYIQHYFITEDIFPAYS